MDTNGNPEFTVDRLSQVDDQIRELFLKAKSAGIRQDYLNVLKNAFKNLRSQPLT